MAIKSDAQRRATAKYEAANYDKILLRIKRGEREAIQNHATLTGESQNAFILRAIRETMKRDLLESADRNAAVGPGLGVPTGDTAPARSVR